jgi:hypothetical protein
MKSAKKRPGRPLAPFVIVSCGVMVLWLTGCASKPVSVTQAAGSYEYHLANHGQGVICFELHPNGSYTLGNAKEVLGSMSMGGTLREQRWTLGGGTDHQELWIGKASLPIERTRSSIRVTVDDDLGMYCDLPAPSL